jgi:hypothetical protein
VSPLCGMLDYINLVIFSWNWSNGLKDGYTLGETVFVDQIR